MKRLHAPINKLSIIICLILAIALYALIDHGIGLVFPGAQAQQSGSGIRFVIDDAAVPNAQSPLDNESPAGIKIPGFANVRIPADTSDVHISLMNPDGNPCYFTYEIVLSETGESLYASEMIEPGTAIQDVTLSRALTAGEYPSIIKVRSYALDTHSEMNGANLKTTLIVL